jgi:acetoin utilization deacetylase AcuC-like enzyme
MGYFVEPRSFPLKYITDVHTEDFLEYIRTAPKTPMTDPESDGSPVEVLYPSIWPYSNRWPVHIPAVMAQVGYYCFDTETPVTVDTFDAAILSANCALTAADLLKEKQQTVYALCRPPGHHAMQNKCGGYCYLNNAAISAAYLGTKAERIAILDVDYHHGNGTQSIFYDTNRVMFISIHADPVYAYPHYSGFAEEKGERSGIGFNLNLPLPSGTTNNQYKAVLDKALHALRDYAPVYLIISLGFDTSKEDPICDFRLTSEFYRHMARSIAALNIPSLIVQEGGYKIEVLGKLATNFLLGWENSEDVK